MIGKTWLIAPEGPILQEAVVPARAPNGGESHGMAFCPGETRPFRLSAGDFALPVAARRFSHLLYLSMADWRLWAAYRLP